ncbi:MAG: hypothetical protein S4CHLAM20_14930 [Chlamydiia bacterium]|nr:hypothetical protein [Chlamydiia bacterium]
MENALNSIKPSEIEDTLVALFEKEKKSNLVKASLFNLIIYTEDTERENYLVHLTKSLIKKFPCRIIFITESSKEGDFLNTKVSALRPEGEDDGFFCELIHFEVSKSYKERISYLVTPHLIPDLPVYLLFAKDPSSGDTPTTLGLDAFPSRIIFDSEYMGHMSEFCSYIATLQQENIDIGDLNWARFASWRSVISKVFSRKEKQKLLATCEEITIRYNSHSNEAFHHNKIQATYLQGWIATNMYWKFETVLCEGGKIVVNYTSKYGTHKIYLEQSSPDESIHPGKITSVVIKNQTESTSFEREESSDHLIKITHCNPNGCEIPVLYPLASEGTGKSLTREIYSRDTSPDFIACIKLLANWNSGIICS